MSPNFISSARVASNRCCWHQSTNCVFLFSYFLKKKQAAPHTSLSKLDCAVAPIRNPRIRRCSGRGGWGAYRIDPLDSLKVARPYAQRGHDTPRRATPNARGSEHRVHIPEVTWTIDSHGGGKRGGDSTRPCGHREEGPPGGGGGTGCINTGDNVETDDPTPPLPFLYHEIILALFASAFPSNLVRPHVSPRPRLTGWCPVVSLYIFISPLLRKNTQCAATLEQQRRDRLIGFLFCSARFRRARVRASYVIGEGQKAREL